MMPFPFKHVLFILLLWIKRKVSPSEFYSLVEEKHMNITNTDLANISVLTSQKQYLGDGEYLSGISVTLAGYTPSL